MILQPEQGLIKYPEYSFNKANKFKIEDMICKVTDTFLTKIVSKLPTVEANQTRRISKALAIYNVDLNDIDTHNDTDDELDTCFFQIFTSSSPTIRADHIAFYRWIDMPMFCNMVKLMIGNEFYSHWTDLMALLSNMPNLEHIISSDLKGTTHYPLNDILLSSMDKLSAAAYPWHDLKIGYGTPLIFNGSESRVHDYTKSQTKTTSNMRANLINWIIEEHNMFELTNETLYLTVNIIDRFLAVETVAHKELKCVGMCAMLIASKYQENRESYEAEDFIQMTCRDYKNRDVFVMEKRILDRLKWKLNVRTPYFFLTWFIKAAEKQPDTMLENMVCFYAELGLMSYKIMRFSPSMVAAAAVYAARVTLNKSKVWHETLELQTGFKETQVMKCAKMMLVVHDSVAKDGKKSNAVYEKYSRYTRGAVALYHPVDLS